MRKGWVLWILTAVLLAGLGLTAAPARPVQADAVCDVDANGVFVCKEQGGTCTIQPA